MKHAKQTIRDSKDKSKSVESICQTPFYLCLLVLHSEAENKLKTSIF